MMGDFSTATIFITVFIFFVLAVDFAHHEGSKILSVGIYSGEF